MTYLYMNRKDGEWARIDVEMEDTDEDLWTFVGRVFPELWNALPPETEFIIGEDGLGFHPYSFETFGRVDDLIEWVEEGENRWWRKQNIRMYCTKN